MTTEQQPTAPAIPPTVRFEPRGWRILDHETGHAIGNVFEVPPTSGVDPAALFLAELYENDEACRVVARGISRDAATTAALAHRAHLAEEIDQLLRDGVTEEEVDRG